MLLVGCELHGVLPSCCVMFGIVYLRWISIIRTHSCYDDDPLITLLCTT